MGARPPRVSCTPGALGAPTHVSMEVAIARLDAAGDRAKQCDELRLAALAELADLQATRKHAKGRPPKAFCAKVHKIEQELRRLEQNVLPGEMPPSTVVQRIPADLATSARENAQHHALPSSVPVGARSPRSRRIAENRPFAANRRESPVCGESPRIAHRSVLRILL